LDALRFLDLARDGRRAIRAGDSAAAADALGQAIRLWRGPALSDLVESDAIAAEAAALHEQYLATYEDWAEAKLAIGHHSDLTERLDELTREHPFRERLRHAQMLALYRCGRQIEALAHFDELRQLLARELGIQPSPVLARLYDCMLIGDRSLDVPAPVRLEPVSVRATGSGRTSLTRDIEDFCGRGREVRELVDVLSASPSGRVLALTGPSGVGKTTLALHGAHRLSRRFPDGRVMTCLRSVEGGPRPACEVLADLLHGMGVIGMLPDRLADRAALLREETSGRRALFILDDAVDEEQVRALLGSVGGSGLIVTSRRHLAGLECAHHVALEPMSGDDSLEMLCRLIGRARVAAEPIAALRLVEICSGLPLLIRVVSAKLNGLRHLPLGRYADRMVDESQLLNQLEAGDLRVRPRLAVSYRDLPPDDQAALRRLAQLPSSTFSAAEAAADLGTDELAAETTIERLLEAHVVAISSKDVESPTDNGLSYILPRPMRAFVREQTEPL
jgi:hypothetical protein